MRRFVGREKKSLLTVNMGEGWARVGGGGRSTNNSNEIHKVGGRGEVATHS